MWIPIWLLQPDVSKPWRGGSGFKQALVQDGLCSHAGWRCCFSPPLFLTKTSGQGLQVAVAKRETVRCRGKAAETPQEPPRPPGRARPACSISSPSPISSASFFPSLQRGKRVPGGVPGAGGVRARVPLLGLEEEHPWEESSVSGPGPTLSRLWWGNLPPPSPARLGQQRFELGSSQNNSNMSSSSSEEGRSHKIREAATCFLAHLDELGHLSCKKREPA